MNYLLSVLTHGDAPTLRPALESFAENVTPSPRLVNIVVDGPARPVHHDAMLALPGTPCYVRPSDRQRGFCAATRRAWEIAALGGPGVRGYDFVFWLEHDFVFLRPLDLLPIAAILARHPALAQMQLMRTPVNAEEIAAGGLYELRQSEYLRPAARFFGDGDDDWLEHYAYFTTNPSLMTRHFMRMRPWPDYPEQCEGRFGIDLRDAAYHYGVWGNGEPWVRHVGERTGHGY